MPRPRTTFKTLQTVPRPYLAIPGGERFQWPFTEGWRVTGSAQLGVHKYIGDNAVVVDVLHLDEQRISLEGQFMGPDGADLMRQLKDVIAKQGPDEGKILWLPHVFTKEQRVVAENYDFSHPTGGDGMSVDYSVTFVFVGVGKKIKVKERRLPIDNPHSTSAGGSRPAQSNNAVGKFFTTKHGAETLRAVAKAVYGDATEFQRLYRLNEALLNKKFPDTSLSALQTKPLGLGLKLKY